MCSWCHGNLRRAAANNGHEPSAPEPPPEATDNAELAEAEVALFERWVVSERERIDREAKYVGAMDQIGSQMLGVQACCLSTTRMQHNAHMFIRCVLV